MMRRLLTTALAALFTTAAFAQTPAPRTAKPTGALALAQGSWVMVTADGQDMSASGQDVVVTITDNSYTQAVNGTIMERGTFKLDETKKPMTIDITVVEGDDAGKIQLGVVEVTATTMRGKLCAPGQTVRPTDFEPAEGFFAFTARKK